MKKRPKSGRPSLFYAAATEMCGALYIIMYNVMRDIVLRKICLYYLRGAVTYIKNRYMVKYKCHAVKNNLSPLKRSLSLGHKLF